MSVRSLLKGIAKCAFALAITASSSVFAEPKFAIPITYTGSVGVSPLEDFPILIKLSESGISGFSYDDLAADGKDLSFSLEDGTPLAHEIDVWDTAGESSVWVKVPALSQGLKIIASYGDDGVMAAPASQSDGSVWGGGYVGVWHMNENGGNALDATGHNLHGVATGTYVANMTSDEESPTGFGRKLAPANAPINTKLAYFLVPNYNSHKVGENFTFSFWVKRDVHQATKSERYVSRKNTWNAIGGWEITGSSDTGNLCVRGAGYPTQANNTELVFPHTTELGDWVHIAATFHGKDVCAYTNGVLAGMQTMSQAATDNGQGLGIGNNNSGNEWNILGSVDEARLLKTTKTPEWIAAEYAVVANNGSVLSYGTAEVLGVTEDGVTIQSSHNGVGSPTPAYGKRDGLSENDEVELSMSETVVLLNGNRYVLQGWELSSFDLETSEETVIRRSTDEGEVFNGCTYVHAGASIFRWLWKEYKPLEIGAFQVAETRYNGATLAVEVAGLGHTSDSGVLKVAYGTNPNALNFTNTCGTITQFGVANGDLNRLQPGLTYFVQGILETADGIATTDVVPIMTPALNEVAWLPGLWQAFFTAADKDWTKDIMSLPEGDDWTNYQDSNRIRRRELGPISAYTYGNTGNATRKYTSEIWGDELWWPVAGGQWVYSGMIYLDAAKTYKFRTFIDDNERIVITTPDGKTTTTLINDVAYVWQSGFTSPSYAPPESGWYAIEIRFSDSSGGAGAGNATDNYRNTFNAGYSEDDGATWKLMLDPGDGSLFRVKTSDNDLQLSEMVENGRLVGFTLTAPVADVDRTIHLALGATREGDDAEAWGSTAVVGTILAGDETLSITLPENWGDEGALVARAYAVEAGAEKAVWSNTIFWRDLDLPVVTLKSIEGNGGDTLVVSGTVEAFPGESASLTVYVGSAPDTFEAVWENVATVTETGDYEITLVEEDTESERYIVPGTTYYVMVEAEADGKVAPTAALAVKTAGAAVFSSTRQGISRRTLTAYGTISDLGTFSQTRVGLYVGESNNPEEMVEVQNKVITAQTEFSFSHALPLFQKTYYWQLRATNQTSGETVVLETRSNVMSVTTVDATIYTWKPSVTEGDWNDPANWTDNYNGDSVGYPNSTAATATFADNTKAKIRFTTANAIGPANFTGGNMDLTFVQGGASTNATRLNITGAVAMNGANSRIVLDNVAMLIAPQVTLGGMTTLCLTNAANLRVNNNGAGILNEAGGTIEVVDESYLNVGPLTIGGGKILVRDAGIWVRDYVRVGSGLPGGTLRFEGTHPYLYASNAGQEFRAAIADAQFAIDFLVPEGGYASAPLKTINNSTKAFMVNSPSAVVINVLDESPANYAQETIETPLIAWNSGFNKDKVTLGNLPMGEVTDDEFVWGVDGAEKTIALGARIVGGSFAGRIEVGNSIALPADAEGIAPAKGIHEIPGVGMTCVAPSTIALEIGGTAMLKGYRIYRVETPSLKKTLIQSGVGNSATIAHTDDFLYLEWQWEAAFGVSAAANDAAMGEVRGAKAVKLGEIAVFEAVAKDGYGFSHWEVGGARYENYRDETLKLQVEGPIQVVAVFVPAVYATPTGAGDKSGSNWENALEGVAGIKAKLAADPNAFIYVADGLYEVRTDGIVLSGSATIAGVSENCGAIFKAMGGLSATSQNAVFRVSAANARIVRVAITTSSVNRSHVARGLYMNAVGFVDRCMITNCAMNTDGGAAWLTGNAVMRNCIFDYNTGGSKGPLLLQDALVENCEITRGSGGWGTVYMDGDVGAGNSIMRGCLVAYNTTTQVGSHAAAGIKLQAGVVDSCTIVSNNTQHASFGMALLIETKKPCTIRNTIIRGNFNKNAESNYHFYTDTKRVSQNCCTYPAMTGTAMLDCDPVFKTSKDGNIFALDRKRSPLVNAGDASGYNGVVGPVDLSGNKRIVRGAIDIGAYEAAPSPATMMVVE